MPVFTIPGSDNLRQNCRNIARYIDLALRPRPISSLDCNEAGTSMELREPDKPRLSARHVLILLLVQDSFPHQGARQGSLLSRELHKTCLQLKQALTQQMQPHNNLGADHAANSFPNESQVNADESGSATVPAGGMATGELKATGLDFWQPGAHYLEEYSQCPDSRSVRTFQIMVLPLPCDLSLKQLSARLKRDERLLKWRFGRAREDAGCELHLIFWPKPGNTWEKPSGATDTGADSSPQLWQGFLQLQLSLPDWHLARLGTEAAVEKSQNKRVCGEAYPGIGPTHQLQEARKWLEELWALMNPSHCAYLLKGWLRPELQAKGLLGHPAFGILAAWDIEEILLLCRRA